MKFELEPYNRGASDTELIADIQAVAKKLGSSVLTQKDYDKNSRFHSDTVTRRFGSWRLALEKAELELKSRIKISPKACLDDLKRIAQMLNKNTVSQSDYEEHGIYSIKPFRKNYDTWAEALIKAGLEVPQFSNEDFFENLEQIWRSLGRQPKYSELIKPQSKFSAKAYYQRFGSWRKALEAFVTYINADVQEKGLELQDNSDPNPATITQLDKNTKSEFGKTRIEKQVIPKRRTSRTVGWRLRFLVMRKDNFTCKLCGKTPALFPGLDLEVDHVVPWSKGGETEPENLQTLCRVCNSGKSDLDMNAETAPIIFTNIPRVSAIS